jgi:hypothetical protein
MTTENREALVQIIAGSMAFAASDWTHLYCGSDDHYSAHTNWQAYKPDAETTIDMIIAAGWRPAAEVAEECARSVSNYRKVNSKGQTIYASAAIRAALPARLEGDSK